MEIGQGKKTVIKTIMIIIKDRKGKWMIIRRIRQKINKTEEYRKKKLDSQGN